MTLERLRELLVAEPSPSVWSEILATVRHAEDAGVAVGYVEGHLADWPDDLRVLRGPESVPWPLRGAPPWWSLGRVLSLRDRNVKPKDLAALLDSQLFDGLTGLDLGYNKLGVEGISTLTGSGRVGQLRWLDLDCGALGDAGFRVLADCEGLASVERLTLRRSGAKSAGCKALLSSPHLRSLRHLELQRNGVGAGGATALAGNPAAAGLEYLDLQDCKLTSRALATVLASPYMCRLHTLLLEANQLDDGDVPALFHTATCAPRLTHLSLEMNNLGYAVGELAHAPLHALRKLNLHGCGVTSQALSALSSAPWAGGLEWLDLGLDYADSAATLELLGTASLVGLRNLRLAVPVLPETLAAILTSPGLPLLDEFRFGAIRVDRSEAGVSLANVPNLHKLALLTLAGAPSGEQEVEAIMAAADLRGVTNIGLSTQTPDAAVVGLARNPTATDVRMIRAWAARHTGDTAARAIAGSPYLRLHSLDMISGALTDVGVAELAASAALSDIRTLRLDGRGLTAKGAASLAACVHLTCVERLGFSGQNIGYDSWDVLTAHSPRVARALLSDQSTRGGTGDPNTNLSGLQGYAKHLGVSGTSRLTMAELIDRLVEARSGAVSGGIGP